MDFTKIQIKPYQIGPLLATPRSLALFFAGATSYIAFIDPNVRNAFDYVRHRLRQWAISFKSSKNILGAVSLIASAFGVAAYFQTNVNLWLAGSALMASIIPYSMFILDPTQKYLNEVDERADPKLQLHEREKVKVVDELSYWMNSQKIKVGISAIAMVLFYLAELKSTENVNVGVVIS